MFACLCLPFASLWKTEPAPSRLSSASDASADCRTHTLVRLARDFSPRIEILDPRVVLLDVTGVGRMFGDAQALGEALRVTAAERGLGLHIAIASSRTAAVLMAVARAGLTIVPPGREALTLAPLPLHLLQIGIAGFDRIEGNRRRTERFSRQDRDPDRHTGNREPDPTPPEKKKGARDPRPRDSGSRHYRLAPAPQTSASGSGRSAIDRDAASPRSTTIVPRATSPLPSDDRELDVLLTLKRWGLATLGDLAALPSSDLFERLGEVGVRLQKRARGEDARPLVPDIEQDPFEASLDLEWPIEGLEPLSFVLGRLFEQLAGRLERADCGAAVLHVRLRLVTKETHARSLQLPAPFRDPRVLRTLSLLDLESHPPPTGIDRVTVAIDPAPGQIVQFSLLQHSRPAPEQLSTLVARLQALMGTDRCGAAALVDTHRAGAFEMQRFTGSSAEPRASKAPKQSSIGRPEASKPARNLVIRRFRVPVAASVRTVNGRPVHVLIHRRGFTGGRVEQCAGPWRSSGDWWRRGAARSAPWNRDEWDVGLSDGSVYRLFQDRDHGRWGVEGVVD